MIEDVREESRALRDFVQFLAAGETGAGVYHCAECRYGVSLTGELPRCPMCGGTVWEPTGASPRLGIQARAR